jgi:hypothetical protein
MKPFALSRNSIHFKLAKKLGGLRTRDYYGDDILDFDFCHYVWCVIFALVKILIFTALFCVTMFSLIDFTYWIKECLASGIWTDLMKRPGGFIAVLAGAGSILTTIFGIVWGVMYNKERRKEAGPKEPGFLKLAYRSFKNKTCVRITMKD